MHASRTPTFSPATQVPIRVGATHRLRRGPQQRTEKEAIIRTGAVAAAAGEGRRRRDSRAEMTLSSRPARRASGYIRVGRELEAPQREPAIKNIIDVQEA